ACQCPTPVLAPCACPEPTARLCASSSAWIPPLRAFYILSLCSPSAGCGAPPEVAHGSPMGVTRDRYAVNSKVRYQCQAGYTQRHLPVIRCMENGQWESPQVECTESEFYNYGAILCKKYSLI
uniref:Sushi domain-containing protein n=1 Tax=Hippocampus comes TaxID=109280 RepID=A0A3Q3E8C7_HIPCM